MTSGTYGPPRSGTLSSCALTVSLGNRLKVQMVGRGSILWQLTWKRLDMPSQRRIYLLRASAHPTSGNDCSGWPTPAALDGDSNKESPESKAARGSGGINLPTAASMVGWQTPSATDGMRGGEMTENMSGQSLTQQARLSGWATPASRDYRTPNHETLEERGGGSKGEQLQNQVAHLIPGASLNGLSVATANSGLLNPDFSRWLQGIPETWGACAPTGTR